MAVGVTARQAVPRQLQAWAKPPDRLSGPGNQAQVQVRSYKHRHRDLRASAFLGCRDVACRQHTGGAPLRPHQGIKRPRDPKPVLGTRARAEVPDFLPSSWTKSKGTDLAGPTLELTGEAAVQLQLSCLQDNDAPYPDHGVEVMYRFASFDPFQRSRYFGPSLDLGQFERFRRLFHHSTYRVLLGHTEHHVLSSFYLSPDRLRQRVRVLGLRPGEEEVFEFTVVQREGGSWDGYWFTESLFHDGEGLSRGIAY